LVLIVVFLRLCLCVRMGRRTTWCTSWCSSSTMRISQISRGCLGGSFRRCVGVLLVSADWVVPEYVVVSSFSGAPLAR
jgi:hypothetical protein